MYRGVECQTLRRLGTLGFKVIHAPEDVDVLAAKTAVENSLMQKTVVIGEGTDVLVLLLYYT